MAVVEEEAAILDDDWAAEACLRAGVIIGILYDIRFASKGGERSRRMKEGRVEG